MVTWLFAAGTSQAMVWGTTYCILIDKEMETEMRN